jgi:hypothetical protein
MVSFLNLIQDVGVILLFGIGRLGIIQVRKEENQSLARLMYDVECGAVLKGHAFAARTHEQIFLPFAFIEPGYFSE